MNIEIRVLWDVTPYSMAEVPACQRMPLLNIKTDTYEVHSSSSMMGQHG